ncbi:MAG: hypothetical protein COT24_00175 [Candidatus Kerfeldbacteria bacterium CG08_land_8_20_14_0_20_40_16]|uniref:Type I restriction modification DNA specificity domain-containing protein n=1 Tax=Candidatus Kerfeldbacteria bacterium CG08_land_8_20_14_0_20_40_16 TaxID=2014244 RepID=A0A2H0YX51_9BACT|nr:MAG: hypothetical protein COT24_00175 [Candidatus Kerfeldbacteria bacterium CG08_land_8_20_14_0_20_40_16]
MKKNNPSWQKVRLGDAVVKKGSVSGPFGSNIHSRFFTSKGVPVIRGNNLSLGVPGKRYIDDDYLFLDEKKADELSNSEALPDDIVLTARGTIGQSGIIPKKSRYPRYILSANQLRFRIDRNKYDPTFVYYWLSSKPMIKMMQNISSNVGVPNMNLATARELILINPSLEIQSRIATILSAFDDKIELNNKINSTLEKMAQAIFKEWFVKLRFPGHEKVEFVDSELGKIPKGWEVSQLKDVVKLNKGLSYKSSEIKDNSMGVPMVNLKCFLRGGGFKSDGIKYYTGEYKKQHIVKPGQLIIAMTDLTPTREVVGRPALIPDIVNGDIIISLDVISVEVESIYYEYLYFLMKRPEFGELMANSASGTTVAHLQKSSIENYQFILPTGGVIRKFHELASPMFTKKNMLSRENKNLSKLRDLLLPKLMKGEVTI